MMDTSGHLRQTTLEELFNSPEELSHMVEVPEDIPDWKLALFRKVDSAGNRKARKAKAKKLNVSWFEYQVYRNLVNLQK